MTYMRRVIVFDEIQGDCGIVGPPWGVKETQYRERVAQCNQNLEQIKIYLARDDVCTYHSSYTLFKQVNANSLFVDPFCNNCRAY